MYIFQKQPDETYPINLDWTDRLPPGKTLSSVAASAVRTDTGATATSTVLGSGSPPVSGVLATVQVKGGTDGIDYLITLKSTFSDGSLLEDEWLMQVREI